MTPVSRLPAFPAARARARHRPRAPKYRACQHKRHLCRACQRFPWPERARGTDPGPLNAAPASTDGTCVAPANVSRPERARHRPMGPKVPRLPAFPAARARARGTGPGPLSTAPASTNDTCVTPASVGPSARARHRPRAPKCRACQHRRHLCRACQRFPRPERARARHRPRAPKYRACQHKRHLCRACQRFPRPERARAAPAQGP